MVKAAVLTFVVLLASAVAPASAAGSSRASTSACTASLTLLLRPGTVPGATINNGPPAGDIPRGPLATHLPLYPGAVPSARAMRANAGGPVLPASYRKVAVAEYQVAANLRQVYGWYRSNLNACGFAVYGYSTFQPHRTVQEAGLEAMSRDGNVWPVVQFKPVSQTLTAIRYVVQAFDLPPRPAASYLHGPFVRATVTYRSRGVIPGSARTYRFTITWPATIDRLVKRINSLTRIYVPFGLGGGAVTFTEHAVVRFVRPDGGARVVRIGGDLFTVTVGKTRRLADTNAMVMKLVDRVVHHRCHGTTCS